MNATTIHRGDAVSVFDYRCTAGPADKPFVEVREAHSLSYVRSGSFGCRTLGEEHELVAGAVLVVRPGREYMATHEHYDCGDECLSVKLSPGLAESLGAEKAWSLGRLPPLPHLMVTGELMQAAADGRSDVGVDEAALLFAARAVGTATASRPDASSSNPKGSRRAVEAALWLEANFAEGIDLEAAAREAGLSPFYFLHTFSRVLGVTPGAFAEAQR